MLRSTEPKRIEEMKTPAEQLVRNRKKKVDHSSQEPSPVKKRLSSAISLSAALNDWSEDAEYIEKVWKIAKEYGFVDVAEAERVLALCQRALENSSANENQHVIGLSLMAASLCGGLAASWTENMAKIIFLRAVPNRQILGDASRLVLVNSQEIPFAETRQLAKRGLAEDAQGAIELLSTLFEKNTRKRAILLEDAAALAIQTEQMLFKDIRISSALLLSLLESTTTWTESEATSRIPTANGAWPCAALAAELWLNRSRDKSLGRRGLAALAEDLVLVLPKMNQWPAAEIMILALVKRLGAFLSEDKDDSVITEAIEALGIVLKGLVALRSSQEKKPSALDLAAAQHVVITTSIGKKRLYLTARFRDLVLSSKYSKDEETKRQEMLAHLAAQAVPGPQEQMHTWPAAKISFSRNLVAAWASPELNCHALECLLAQQLGGARATIRARALKALEPALNARLDESILQAMRARLCDEAASVRQAAVEVLSAVNDNRFKEALLDRLHDRALGVRKAAVRYIRQALAINDQEPSNNFAQRALTQLASRCAAADEEDTVKNLAVDAVRDAWFGPLTARVESSQGMPIATRQLVNVLADVTTEDSRLVIALVLRSALGGESRDDASTLASCGSVSSSSVAKEAREKKRRAVAELRAVAHVKALVAELLRLEGIEGDTSGNEVAVLRAIGAIASAEPRLGASAAWSIAPLLHQSSGTALCCAAAEALAACVPGMARREALTLSEDVVPALGTASHALGGSKALEATISCLATFAALGQVKAVDTLHSLARTYLGALDAITSRPAGATPSPARKRGAGARAMVILGLVCQYFGYGLTEAFVDKVYKALLGALLRPEGHQQRTPAAKIRAVTALAGLIQGCPRFASSAALDGTVASILFHQQESVQARARQAWAHLLDGCGKSVLTTASDGEDETAAQHLESVGAALQSYLPQLLNSLRQGSASELRRASLSLLNAALRHGLLNPREAVSELLAALSDSDSGCRTIALDSLTKIHARRPSFVTSRFFHGLALALDTTSDETAHIVLPVLARTYAKLILPDAKTRAGVLRSIIELFDTQPPSTSAQAMATWIRSRRRAARLLALLPASSQEDPLFILYHIGRILSVHAAALRELDSQEAPVQAAAAAAFGLLLRLRRHLRCHFNLSDAKCLAYVPSTSIKPVAKSSTSTSTFSSNPPDYQDLDLDFPIPFADEDFTMSPLSPSLRVVLNDFNTLFDLDILGRVLSTVKSSRTTTSKRRSKAIENDDSDDDQHVKKSPSKVRKRRTVKKKEQPVKKRKAQAPSTITSTTKRASLSRTSKLNVCYTNYAYDDEAADDEESTFHFF